MVKSIEILFKPYFIKEFYEFEDKVIDEKTFLSIFDYQGFICTNDKKYSYRPDISFKDNVKEMFKPLKVLNITPILSRPYITLRVEFEIDGTFINLINLNGDEDAFSNIARYFIFKFGLYGNTDINNINVEDQENKKLIKKLYNWIDESETEKARWTDTVTIISFGLIFENIAKLNF